MPGLSRRAVLGALAGAPVAAAAAAQGAAEPIVVAAPNVADVVCMDLLNAKAGGHFAAERLDVTLAEGGTGVGAMQQLVAGRCHFLRGGAIDLIKAVARQNVPLLSIATLEHRQTYLLVSSPQRPIRDPSMLRGKRIGVFAINSTSDTCLALALHHAGLPNDAVDRQITSFNPAAFELVRMGRLDGMVISAEGGWPLLHPSGGGPPEAFALPFSAIFTMPGRCYLTTRSLVDQRPALVRAFMRAMAASVQELIGGPAEALVARCTAAFDMSVQGPTAQTAAVVRWMTGVWMAEGRANLLRNLDAGWRGGVAEMADAGLANLPPGAELITNRFVEEVMPK